MLAFSYTVMCILKPHRARVAICSRCFATDSIATKPIFVLAFYSATSFRHEGESLCSNNNYRGLGLNLLKTESSAYLIDFAFCLISPFLTKVIRKHPNLDPKYYPIGDQKGHFLNMLCWVFASLSINLFKNQISMWQTGAWYNMICASALYHGEWKSEIANWDSLR